MAFVGDSLILGGDLGNPPGGWQDSSRSYYDSIRFAWKFQAKNLGFYDPYYNPESPFDVGGCWDAILPPSTYSYTPSACSAQVLASYLMSPTATPMVWPSDSACGWSGFGPWSEADCHSGTVEVYDSLAVALDVQYGMRLANGTTLSWTAKKVVNPGQPPLTLSHAPSLSLTHSLCLSHTNTLTHTNTAPWRLSLSLTHTHTHGLFWIQAGS